MLAVPLTGILYKKDNLTVHKIILRNIADTSDALTYVKSYIKNNNIRTDIKALRSRYENVAMQEQYVSEANILLLHENVFIPTTQRFDVRSDIVLLDVWIHIGECI